MTVTSTEPNGPYKAGYTRDDVPLPADLMTSLVVRTHYAVCTRSWERCPGAAAQSHGIIDDNVRLGFMYGRWNDLVSDRGTVHIARRQGTMRPICRSIMPHNRQIGLCVVPCVPSFSL